MTFTESFALVNESTKNHDQQRIRADNERHIARRRNRKRRVLRPKVKRATRKPAYEQNQFVLPVFAAELLMRNCEKQKVRHHESKRENLHRRELVVQKHLRAHETRAPKGDGYNRKHVPKG